MSLQLGIRVGFPQLFHMMHNASPITAPNDITQFNPISNNPYKLQKPIKAATTDSALSRNCKQAFVFIVDLLRCFPNSDLLPQKEQSYTNIAVKYVLRIRQTK